MSEAVKKLFKKEEKKVFPPTPGIDVFRNYRYEDQKASAIEVDIDSPASTIQERRNRIRAIEKLHGKNPPTKDKSDIVNLIRINTDILDKLNKLVGLELAKQPEGDVYGYDFTLTPSSNVAHFDFVDGTTNVAESSADLPGTFEFPYKPLFSLYIRNDGPADIKVSINRTGKEVVGTIKSGSDMEFGYERAVIYSLNIAVKAGATSDASITMFGST